MGRWLRHRPGGVALTAGAVTQECTHIGENGLSTPFRGICVHCCAARIVRAAVVTQECTQIGQNGLSTPFWGICVHCCDLRGSFERPWRRRSVHRSAKTDSRRRFGALVYTVATRFAEASTHTNLRRAKNVPRLEKSTRSASGPLRARQAAFELVHQQPDVVHGGLRLGVQV